MAELLTAAAPFSTVLVLILLMVMVVILAKSHEKLTYIHQVLLYQYELDKTRQAEANANAKDTAAALESVAEQTHKIAIHFAPYLMTEKDVLDRMNYDDETAHGCNFEQRVQEKMYRK